MPKLSRDEKRILKITRLVPILVLIVSILLITFITNKNNERFKNDVSQMKEESIAEHKNQVKNEVYRVHQFIVQERLKTNTSIKQNMKSRTNEAYAIIQSIYEKNSDKKPQQIQKIIKDALIDIRFNDGRGYFFIYDTSGTVFMHPILSHLEATNLWDLQDVKGQKVIQSLSTIATQKDEGFLTWWWNKPGINNTKEEFEKIGYVKHFKPYNWFIGTGEYVVDFESDLKEELLTHIQNISSGKNNYMFVIDNTGQYLAHYRDDYIGQNRINIVDKNGLPFTQEIIKIANSGEGYLSYVGTVKPTTGLPAEKISFIKGYSDWGWAIGTGVYLSEINEIINQKQLNLDKKNQQELYKIIILGSAVCVPLFILFIFISNQIKSRFQSYKNHVLVKSNELQTLNKELENIVIQRTETLQNTIIDLKQTQEKLVETEKMASMMGLVSGVAHEINTPFGIAITALSQTEEDITNLLIQLKEQKLTKSYLAQFEEASQVSYELINKNMKKAINLIENFKSLSLQEKIEEKKDFQLTDAIEQSIYVNKHLLENEDITVSIQGLSDIKMNSHFNAVFDVFNQLIQNSLIHAFNKNNKSSNKILISSSMSDSFIIISYEDNGQGIDEKDKDKIFEPFYTTKRNTSCTGLGMSILYNRIVHQLGGEIVFKSELASGFKLQIKLPNNCIKNHE